MSSLEEKERVNQIEIMRSAGITEAQIESLKAVRNQVVSGTRSEFTLEFRRFIFIKALYAAGRLQS